MPDIFRGSHQWVGAANVSIEQKQVSRAVRRGSVRVVEDMTIDVLEVYCAACKQPYDRAVKVECVLGDHHRGGPIGTRAKRKGVTQAEDGATQAPAAP